MLTRRGLFVAASAVALGVAGAAYGVEEFVLAALAGAGALCAAAAVVLVSAPRARRALRVEVRRPPAEISVGDDAAATLVVANAGATALPALWLRTAVRGWSVSLPGFAAAAGRPAGDGASRRSWPVSRLRLAPPADARVPVPPLAPGGRAAVAVPVPTGRRGLWSLAPQRVWCADPLGLVARCVARSPALHLVVCPQPARAVVSAGPAGLGGRDPTIEAHGHSSRSHGGGDELAGLRAYAAGDRLARLHWPAMARTGDLVVREFVEPEARSLRVTVDDRPLIVEGAVSSAARLGLAALDDGTVVDLVTNSGDRLRVAPGPSARRTLLQALAVVAPATQWR